MNLNKGLAKFLILFSWFSIPSSIYRVGGLISLNWIYFTSLIFILFLSVIFTKKIVINQITKYYLLFVLFLILSIIWSYSPLNSLRYLNKFLLSALLMIFFSRNLPEIKELHQRIFIAIILFLIVNWIAEITIKNYLWEFPAGQYFEGFGGRHQIKYYVAFSIIFSLTSYLMLKQKKFLITFALLCITLILILQRGVILALVIGLIFVIKKIYKGGIKFRIRFAAILLLIIISVIYFLFYTEKGISYMFYSYEQRDKFLYEVFRNPIYAIRYIDFKGRLEYWDALFSSAKIVWGVGFGSSGRIIEEYFGFYNEPHNDWLQIYVELGLVSLFLYILFWLNFLKVVKKVLSLKINVYEKTIAYTALGYGVYIIVNGFLDHVIDYPSTAICLSICVGAVSSIYRNHLIKSKKLN